MSLWAKSASRGILGSMQFAHIAKTAKFGSHWNKEKLINSPINVLRVTWFTEWLIKCATLPWWAASTEYTQSISLKSKSKRYVLPSESKKKCEMFSVVLRLVWKDSINLPYWTPRFSASSLVIISPTYSITKLFLRIVSSVLTPHPQPLLVRKMQSFNWCFKKDIWLLFLIDFVKIYKNTTFDPRWTTLFGHSGPHLHRLLHS